MTSTKVPMVHCARRPRVFTLSRGARGGGALLPDEKGVMMITPEAGFKADAGHLIEQLAGRVDAFRYEIGEAVSEIGTKLGPIRARVEADLEAVRRAYEIVLAAGEESFEYTLDEFEFAVDRLRSDLRMGHADLEAEMADSLEPYRAAADEQLDATRGALEQLSLRAHLARMDLADDIESLNRELRHLHRILRTEWYRGRKEAMPAVEALRTNMRHGLDDVRTFVDTLGEKLTS